VIKEITSARSRFPKPVKIYKSLLFFGPNIVASEGDEWKKHRRPVAPAFNDRNNTLVWDESIKVVLDLFTSSEWRDKPSVIVDHCVDITLPIALFVIGIAGFGRRLTWEDSSIPAGHTMTFTDALHWTSISVINMVIVPSWLLEWKESWRKGKQSLKELRSYMTEMIQERRNGQIKEDRSDLFSALLEDTNESESEKEEHLTDEEMMGDIFIFLIAGHETSAHTLAFTFGLLAIYQDEQERLYQDIKSVIPDGRIPTYEEMPKFKRSLAVFYETLRLFPPVHSITKVTTDDCSFSSVVHNENGTYTQDSIHAPKSTMIAISIVGAHYNPRYWEDPTAFNPDRFLAPDWPRDAFIPFSAGPRACIGRKFFETEGIAVLTMLISKYRITVKPEPQYAGLSQMELREKLLQASSMLTITPNHVPLVFTRRT